MLSLKLCCMPSTEVAACRARQRKATQAVFDSRARLLKGAGFKP